MEDAVRQSLPVGWAPAAQAVALCAYTIVEVAAGRRKVSRGHTKDRRKGSRQYCDDNTVFGAAGSF